MKSTLSQSLALPKRLSLIAQTVESLQEGILTGHWQEYLPPERKLSIQLQVSRSTLRSSLKELERSGWLEVNDRKRRKILRRRKSHGIGNDPDQSMVRVIAPTPLFRVTSTTSFVLSVLRDSLAQAGFSMEIHDDRAFYSNRPARALSKLVTDHPASVWLLLYSKEAMERWFVREKLPCLVMGSSRPHVALPSVDADHRAVGHHAGGVLLRNGHRRIALVLPEDIFGGDEDCEQGLRDALGDSQDAKMQVLRHNGSTEHLCALLDKSLLQPFPPTAFFVARPIHTLAVLVHLLHRGKTIPHDIALISRDDDTFLAAINPPITRYTTNTAQFARRISSAARQLAETGIIPIEPIRLMPEFIPGETV